jgi:hypothetical protein
MRAQRWLMVGALGAVLGMVPGIKPAFAQDPPATPVTKPSKKMAPAAMAAPTANQLTEAEKKEGWTLLFDGKTMTGWRGYKKATKDAPDTTKPSNGRWAVQNGALCLPSGTGQDTHGARDIISSATYKSFDLKWQWKIASGGNSGLKYFVTEKHETAIGHEYQMIDDDRHPDAKIGPHRATGAFYDVMPPDAAAKKVKPIGEWNDSRVVVAGNHVEHWLNGAKILEYTLDTPEVKAQIAKSKFKEIEDFDKALDAHILLQDHGDEVCFRSVKILVKK